MSARIFFARVKLKNEIANATCTFVLLFFLDFVFE
jgi:hypothetical protein